MLGRGPRAQQHSPFEHNERGQDRETRQIALGNDADGVAGANRRHPISKVMVRRGILRKFVSRLSMQFFCVIWHRSPPLTCFRSVSVFVRFRFEMFPVHALADVRMRLQTMLLQAMTFQRFLDGVEKRHAICQIM